MGSVSIDIHKKERDYRHLTLSDKDVVKYLIMYRSKIDISYGASINIDIGQAGDVFDFNQELIALYASMDEIVSKCKFTSKQSKILKQFYDGYTAKDISKLTGANQISTYRVLDRIVEKIVNENNSNWKAVMQRKGLIKQT